MSIVETETFPRVIGGTDQFEIVVLTTDLIPGALKTMREFFLHQPFCSAYKIDAESVADLEKLCLHVAAEGLTLAAVHKSTGVVAATAFNSLHVKLQEGELSSLETFIKHHCKHENCKELLRFFDDIDCKTNINYHYKSGCVLEMLFISTLPEYRKRGLGKILTGQSLELAKRLKSGEFVIKPLEIDYQNKKIIGKSKENIVPEGFIITCLSNVLTRVTTDLKMTLLIQLDTKTFYVQGETLASRLGKENLPIIVQGIRI